MYKQVCDLISKQIISISRLSDGVFIPFVPDNTDYQNFKNDIANGAELKDQNGKKMTIKQVQKFIETLP